MILKYLNWPRKIILNLTIYPFKLLALPFLILLLFFFVDWDNKDNIEFFKITTKRIIKPF